MAFYRAFLKSAILALALTFSIEVKAESCVEDPFAGIEQALSSASQVTGPYILKEVRSCPVTRIDDARRLYHKAIESKLRMPATATRTIAGMQFFGEVSELDAVALAFSGRLPSSARNIISRCARPGTVTVSPRCALTVALRSEESALLVLTSAHTNGYVPSLEQDPSAEAIWTPHQLWTFVQASRLVPLHLIPRGLKKVRLFPTSTKELCGGQTWGGCAPDEGIWLKTTAVATEYILHEIGHGYDRQQNSRDVPDGPNAKKWIFERGRFDTLSAAPGPKITQYATTGGAKEDYADSFMAYIHQPQELKVLFPETYEYFKSNVFTDNGRPIEYGGLSSWPELQQNGGSRAIKQALHRCLARFTALDPLSEKVSIRETRDYEYEQVLLLTDSRKTIRRVIPVKSQYSYDIAVDTINHRVSEILSQCVTGTAERLAPTMAASANYCEHGGLQGIQERLKHAVQRTLGVILKKAQKAGIPAAGFKERVSACLTSRTSTDSLCSTIRGTLEE